MTRRGTLFSVWSLRLSAVGRLSSQRLGGCFKTYRRDFGLKSLWWGGRVPQLPLSGKSFMVVKRTGLSMFGHVRLMDSPSLP